MKAIKKWSHIWDHTRNPVNFNIRDQVCRVILCTRLCMEWGIPYTGEAVFARRAPQQTIQDGSYEQRIVANFIERGASIKCTQAAINIVKLRLNLPPLTVSSVQECIRRMNSKIVPAQNRAQGNIDADSKWAKSRHAQTDQMVRFIGTNHTDE